MSTLYELKKEVTLLKTKLQVLVSEPAYDNIISKCGASLADEKLIDALALLEDSLVEFSKVRG